MRVSGTEAMLVAADFTHDSAHRAGAVERRKWSIASSDHAWRTIRSVGAMVCPCQIKLWKHGSETQSWPLRRCVVGDLRQPLERNAL
jgi:hypothetical protein